MFSSYSLRAAHTVAQSVEFMKSFGISSNFEIMSMGIESGTS